MRTKHYGDILAPSSNAMSNVKNCKSVKCLKFNGFI